MSGFLTWFPTGLGAWSNGIAEIAVLAVAFYFVIGLFRDTRGEEVMWGFVLTVGALFLLTKVFHLEELQWMLQSLTTYVVTGAIVVFHPEIRRALAEVGKKHVQADVEVSEDTLSEIEDAIDRLSKEKIGALIAIERENNLHSLQESGRVLDAEVTADLLCTIFYPGTALHDGGVVISKNRLVRAGCMFPMATGRGDVEKNVEGMPRRVSIGRLGMRHRAALGLSEDTDAVVIVVSEETGAIRVATNRKLTDVLEIEGLTKILNAFFVRKAPERHDWFRRWRTVSAAERAAVTEDAVIEDAGVAVEVPGPAPAKEEAPAAGNALEAESAAADDDDESHVEPPPPSAAAAAAPETFTGGHS